MKMKLRRTLTAVIISLAIVTAVTVGVLLYAPASFGSDFLGKFVEYATSGSGDLKIKLGKADKNLLRTLVISDVSIDIGDENVFRADNVRFSVGIADLFRVIGGKPVKSILVSADGGSAFVSDKLTDYIRKNFSKGGSSSAGMFSSVGYTINLTDFTLSADLMGYTMAPSVFDINVRTDEKFDVRSMKVQTNGVSIQSKEPGNVLFTGKLSAYTSGDHSVLLSAENVTGESASRAAVFSMRSFRADLGNFREFLVRPQVSAKLDGVRFEMGDNYVKLESLSVDAVYSLTDFVAKLNIDVTDLDALYNDFTLLCASANIYATVEREKDTVLSISTSLADVQSQWADLSLADAKAVVNISTVRRGSINGKINSGHLLVKEVYDSTFSSYLDRLESEDIDISFSMDGRDAGNRVMGFSFNSNYVSGNSPIEAVGVFSASFSASAGLTGSKLTSADIKIDSAVCRAVPVPVSLTAKLNDGNLISEMRCKGLYAVVHSDAESGESDVKISFTDFRPDPYTYFLENYAKRVAGYVSENSRIDGSIGISARKNSVFTGDLTVNLTGSSFTAGSKEDIDANLTARLYLDEQKLSVPELSVSVMGFTASYAGVVDRDTKLPQGEFSLVNTDTGKSIAGIDFSLSENGRSYLYSGTFSFIPRSRIEGTIEWSSENIIDASSYFISPYQTVPVHILIDTKKLVMTAQGPIIRAEFAFSDNSVLTGSGYIRDTLFHLERNDRVVKSNSAFNLMYSVPDGKYEINLTGAEIELSNIARLGFDMRILNNRIESTHFSFGRLDTRIEFEGFGYVEYGSISDIINFNTSAFSGYARFFQKDADGRVVLILNNNNYSADIKIESDIPLTFNMLGERGEGFYADMTLWDLTFQTEFREGVLTIVSRSGDAGFLSYRNLNISVDLETKNLMGSAQLFKEVESELGNEVIFNAALDISSTFESIRALFLTYTGMDAPGSIYLGLKDARIGNDIKLEDSVTEVSFGKGAFSFNGSFLNGAFRPDTGRVDISISPDFVFSFKAAGYLGKNLDLLVTDVSLPLPIVSLFMQEPRFTIMEGVLEGDILIKGPSSDPSFHGMFYLSKVALELFWMPDQVIISNSMIVSVTDHTITVAPTPAFGYNPITEQFFNAVVKFNMEVQNLKILDFKLDIDADRNPLYIWIPIYINMKSPLDIRGQVTGHLSISKGDGTTRMKLTGDIKSDNFKVGFSFPEDMPEWFFRPRSGTEIDMNITSGQDDEFSYPDNDNPILSFTLNEGETVHLKSNPILKKFEAEGTVSFKTGHIFYFQNDFYITKGSITLKKPMFDENSVVEASLDLEARLREYDSDGKQIDIYLILQNASLDNMNPRFESTPAMSQTEIMQILGHTLVPETSDGITLQSLASAAYAAADAFSSLGYFNNGFSVTSGMRDALKLDMLSIRSFVLQNMIINSLPGKNSKNRNFFASYLDGTSLFAGKYFGNGLFGRTSLILSSSGTEYSDSLKIDVELSVDWDNVLGSFSIFTRPSELSVFSFLDNIGFSFTKRFFL